VYDGPMDIEYAVLADYAEIVGGKLYLMGGGWDVNHVQATPAALRLAVAVGVRIEWQETDQPVALTIRVEDDDGREYVRIDGTLQTSRPANLPPGTAQLSQLAANVSVTLPAAGGYRVRTTAVLGDDEVEQRLPFRVLVAVT
jgi:hypothetical protein